MRDPLSVTVADATDVSEEAAGFNSVHSVEHWVTGLPLSEPASHSSPSSWMPLPQGTTDEEEDDDSDETDELLDEEDDDELLEEELLNDELDENDDALERLLDDFGRSQSGMRKGLPSSSDDTDDAEATLTADDEEKVCVAIEERDDVTAADEGAVPERKHLLGRPPHTHPCSVLQFEEHPSPLARSPSSHSSAPNATPSPHTT